MGKSRKVLSMLLLAMLVTIISPANAMASEIKDVNSDTNIGKVTIINNDVEKSIDFSKCITIYDEKGNVVNQYKPRYVRPGGSFTLKNGWSASCNPEPLSYYNSMITMYASCSAGDVSNLRAEAEPWDNSGYQETIGNFFATQGIWYGKCQGYLSQGETDYLFVIRNTGSDPITVDSVTINF